MLCHVYVIFHSVIFIYDLFSYYNFLTVFSFIIILVSRYVWKDVSAAIHIYRGESFLDWKRWWSMWHSKTKQQELTGFSDTLTQLWLYLYIVCPLPWVHYKLTLTVNFVEILGNWDHVVPSLSCVHLLHVFLICHGIVCHMFKYNMLNTHRWVFCFCFSFLSFLKIYSYKKIWIFLELAILRQVWRFSPFHWFKVTRLEFYIRLYSSFWCVCRARN